jgi:crotonobetainyl-CoA:carnitine CoA-transferase CaiB-like acyl-CoA transferase
MAELANDPRFETNERRHANRAELEPILERAFAKYDCANLLARFHERGIPSAPVNSVAEALADPQVVHRGMVRAVAHTLGGEIRVLGNPIKFSRSHEADFISPPTLGQHTESVLREVLEYTPERIETLWQQARSDLIRRADRDSAKPQPKNRGALTTKNAKDTKFRIKDS